MTLLFAAASAQTPAAADELLVAAAAAKGGEKEGAGQSTAPTSWTRSRFRKAVASRSRRAQNASALRMTWSSGFMPPPALAWNAAQIPAPVNGAMTVDGWKTRQAAAH